MADQLPYPPDTGARPDRGSTTTTPRWVKVFGIVALVLILLFAVMHLTGGGLGGHGLSGGPGGHTPLERGRR